MGEVVILRLHCLLTTPKAGVSKLLLLLLRLLPLLLLVSSCLDDRA